MGVEVEAVRAVQAVLTTVLIGTATYLMAVDSDVASWVFYGAAGVVTLGMAAIPWYFLRELRAELGT